MAFNHFGSSKREDKSRNSIVSHSSIHDSKHNKNFHRSPTVPVLHIVVLIRQYAIIIAGILTGGNQMQKNSQDFSMQEALRLANSPAGQQLLAMLRSTDSDRLEKAAAEVSAGNYTDAGKTIRQLLSSPEIRKFLDDMGGK